MNAQRTRRPFAHPVKESAREKGVTLFVATVSLVFLIPVVGLAVDVGFLYSVKARMQAAVDGAALGAARALNLGQTTSSQASAAQANAVNWFYANFPAAYMGTSSTVMSTGDVQVFDDPVNPLVRNVTVQAQTNVPTYFMRWLAVFFPSGQYAYTTVRALGNAARRDVVVMLVLDRSGSMNSNSGCSNMRAAAKLFVGQFANGRDRIGMVTFSDTVYMEQAPTQSFQTALGYTNSFGSGTGKIDAITCNDNTGIPQAVRIGYNELYKTALPGALNVMMFMTDGLPNTVTVDLKNSIDMPAAGTTITSGTGAGQSGTFSACQDQNGRPANALTPGARADFVNFPRKWNGSAISMGTGSLLPTVPAGMIGAVGTGDVAGSATWGVRKFWATGTAGGYNHGTYTTTNAPGCVFPSNENNFSAVDVRGIPQVDVYGTSLTGYLSTSTRTVNGTTQLRNDQFQTMVNAAFNASDNAAKAARTNATIPAYVFAVGLGGTTGSPPDYVLLQRMSNDPNGDLFNTPPLYPQCSADPTCTTSTNEPSGTFIFSSSPSQLGQAFLKISSMILRLSR